MTKIQAYFPDDLYLELKLQAKRENGNFSELLRTISKNYLKQKNKKNPLQDLVGKIKSYPNFDPEGALNHNDIYFEAVRFTNKPDLKKQK